MRAVVKGVVRAVARAVARAVVRAVVKGVVRAVVRRAVRAVVKCDTRCSYCSSPSCLRFLPRPPPAQTIIISTGLLLIWFEFDIWSLGLSSSYSTTRKSKLVSTNIKNVWVMHECCSQHLRMGTVRMNETKRQKKKASREGWITKVKWAGNSVPKTTNRPHLPRGSYSPQ